MTLSAEDFKAKLQQLGLGTEWEWNNGAWWTAQESNGLRARTEQLIQLDARFVAITAIESPDKEIRLDYQWDVDGQLLCFTAHTTEQHIATIADLAPAADWVERETHEYFSVEFIGREHTRPLMTRPGDPIGINLHKESAQ